MQTPQNAVPVLMEKPEEKYQGLYETGDGRKGWFDISKDVYLGFLKGETMLCQDVRLAED